MGRSAIIESTKRILRELPPARITITMVARGAGVDPALVRYYFKNRSNLLMEVVDDLLQGLPKKPEHVSGPAEFIRQRVHETHKFSRSAKHMQRLMLDELAEAKSDEVRERHRDLNQRAIAVYKDPLDHDKEQILRSYDPMFLYLVIVGIFDFFVSAELMVKNLAPPGADMDKLSEDYTEFVTDLLLHGLLRR